MYFGSFQQLSLVNTGFPPSKVPIRRKLGDRQNLEEEVRDLKEERDDASRNNKQEQARDVEYQLEALQEELQQRKFH